MENTTKQIIKEKAIALFYEKGYHSTTINDICAACKITKRTFYYHYASKGDILQRITHDLGEIAKQNLLKHLADSTHLEKVWIIMNSYSYGGKEYGPDIIKQVYLLSLENNHDEHFPYDTDMYHTVCELIQSAKMNGEITNQAKATELADLLYHTFRSITITWAFENGSFSLQDAYQNCFQTIFKS